jgi:hypothetical protein
MGLYGGLLKMVYLKFREGVMHSLIYALATLYRMCVLSSSIEVWSQTLMVSSFAFVLILLGKTFFNLQMQAHSPELFQKSR